MQCKITTHNYCKSLIPLIHSTRALHVLIKDVLLEQGSKFSLSSRTIIQRTGMCINVFNIQLLLTAVLH